MPYIDSKRKKIFKSIADHISYINEGIVNNGFSAGDMNYLFTLIIKQYIRVNRLTYKSINDIVGSLECCKQEFYDRVVRKYENKKIKQNGDVY